MTANSTAGWIKRVCAIRRWRSRTTLVALVIWMGLWPGPLDSHAQNAFRVEAEGSHLPTYGNAYALLAAGEPGELSVVALANPDGVSNRIAFVVRNNTPDVLIPWVTASVRVADSDETLDGMAFNPNGFPFVVEPGNLMIGEILFETPVPLGASLDVTVTGERPSPDLLLQDDLGSLQLDSFDAVTGTGVLSNPAVRENVFLDNFWRRMACFADGELQRLVVIDIDARSLTSAESSSFRLMQADPGACESFIFAGHGTMCQLQRGVKVCGADLRRT